MGGSPASTSMVDAPSETTVFVDTRFHWMMLAIAGTLVACDLILARTSRLDGFGQVIGREFYCGFLLSLVWCYARWRGYAKFQEASLMTGWAAVLTTTLSALIQLAGRTSAPLADLKLSRLDAAIGWNTSHVVAMTAHAPILRGILLLVYNSLPLLVIGAVLVPVLGGRPYATRVFVLSVTIAGVITSILFACLPAAGPWTVYGYAPMADQVTAHDYLHALKTTGPMTMDFEKSGVVAFPSFHTVLALLCAAALCHINRLRWIIGLTAAGIVVSTVTTGWHYGVDVIGGVLVALASQVAARATLHTVTSRTRSCSTPMTMSTGVRIW